MLQHLRAIDQIELAVRERQRRRVGMVCQQPFCARQDTHAQGKIHAYDRSAAEQRAPKQAVAAAHVENCRACWGIAAHPAETLDHVAMLEGGRIANSTAAIGMLSGCFSFIEVLPLAGGPLRNEANDAAGLGRLKLALGATWGMHPARGFNRRAASRTGITQPAYPIRLCQRFGISRGQRDLLPKSDRNSR